MLELLESRGLLEALLAGMQDGLSVVDRNGKLFLVNGALCRMTGFSQHELVGCRPPFPYWPEEHSATIQQALARAMAGESASYEFVYKRKDGTRFEVIVAPSPLRDAADQVVGSFATIKDISDRKRLERSLAQSEQRWRSIAENPFDFVVVIDRDHRYVYVNHTAPGIPPESLIGRATPFEFVDARYHATMREAFCTTFETGQATSYEVYVPQLDAWYSSIVGPITENGVVTSISILTREITQQKRAEEALRRSDERLREVHKLKSLGTLAGGIAHDLNNILTPILTYAELAQLSGSLDAQNITYMEGVRSAALRARDLVQRILLFGRRREAHKAVIDLGNQIREGLKLFRASLPSSIVFTMDLPAEPVYVLGDAAQLDQALTNLASNALQAMSETGGRLGIALKVLPAAAPPGEARAQVTVTDSGPGMSDDVRRRAFEPFFTTKPVGQGTGLGLSIVHGIIADHGGEVRLDNAPGGGTVVTLDLPLMTGAHPSTTTPVASPAASTPPRRALRVLCVDDESGLIAVIERALQRNGHVATACSSALVALERFRQDPDAFDVLLTDQTMPDLLGTALIEAIRALRPSLPCVLMTGLGDADLDRRVQSLGIGEILAKPFLTTDLVHAIERATTRDFRRPRT